MKGLIKNIFEQQMEWKFNLDEISKTYYFDSDTVYIYWKNNRRIKGGATKEVLFLVEHIMLTLGEVDSRELINDVCHSYVCYNEESRMVWFTSSWDVFMAYPRFKTVSGGCNFGDIIYLDESSHIYPNLIAFYNSWKGVETVSHEEYIRQLKDRIPPRLRKLCGTK